MYSAQTKRTSWGPENTHTRQNRLVARHFWRGSWKYSSSKTFSNGESKPSSQDGGCRVRPMRRWGWGTSGPTPSRWPSIISNRNICSFQESGREGPRRQCTRDEDAIFTRDGVTTDGPPLGELGASPCILTTSLTNKMVDERRNQHDADWEKTLWEFWIVAMQIRLLLSANSITIRIHLPLSTPLCV